ncbi:hypothetical protein ACLK1S_11330 [Escherichia coli]
MMSMPVGLLPESQQFRPQEDFTSLPTGKSNMTREQYGAKILPGTGISAQR